MEIMAILLRENPKEAKPRDSPEGILILSPEFGGNNVILSLGEVNIYI